MPAATPFAPVVQCDEIASTSCTEADDAPLVRESQTKARGVWKIAVVATVTGLIAAAGTTWWSQTEAAGDHATGLAADWAMYGSIGCTNWAKIEIGRSQVANEAECATKCETTAGCTMYNWQQNACEPGWPVARGCLLFKETCETERNTCWKLNYKLKDAEITVTQALTMEFKGTNTAAEMATEAALAERNIKPVTVKAERQRTRRLVGEGRNLQIMTWVVTWTFKTTSEAEGNNAYDFAVSMLKSEEVVAKFTADALKAAKEFAYQPPGGYAMTITNVGEPVKESGGTTETPSLSSTTA